MQPARLREILGAALVSTLVVLAITFGARCSARVAEPLASSGDPARFSGEHGSFALTEATGRLALASADDRSRLDVDLSLLVDGVERPLVFDRGALERKDPRLSRGSIPVAVGSGATDARVDATLELRFDLRLDAVVIALTIPPTKEEHAYALRASFADDGRILFVPGKGEPPVGAEVETTAVVVDDELRPFAVLAPGGATLARVTPDVPTGAADGARPRTVLTTRGRGAEVDPRGARTPASLEVAFLAGLSDQAIWGRIWELSRVPAGRVRGVVKGTSDCAHVFALDEGGRPQLRARASEDGRFEVFAPTRAVQWYAAATGTQMGAPAHFAPGTAWDLALDVSPGGELRVRIVDEDRHKPVVARLVVHGIDGTRDPSFGPDYRASGAGPLMDITAGPVVTPVPAGKYRVSATKGLEWSIDARDVEVTSGARVDVDLHLRHVVPSPGLVACDLHVHARPSFDSPVTPEDRVLSLVSAGIDFAVPTEHNVVGDYAPALALLRLGPQLAHVPGVEITTYNPRFGHFGVFPYPVGKDVPAFRGTSAAGVLASARRGDPTRVVQVNHPRLASGIGYFATSRFDPSSGRVPAGMRTDFDTLEVYNGYDLAERGRVDEVMADWYALLDLDKRIAATGSSDSHRIQYQWAGYPRTYAVVDARAAGDTGAPIDTRAVVAAIARGRSFVTSGPLVELSLEAGSAAAFPGDELKGAAGRRVTARVKVRAAPWVDVTRIEVLAGGPAPDASSPGAKPLRAVVHAADVPARATVTGIEQGSLAEAAERTVRSDDTVTLDLPEGTRWVVAIVRGERRLDDVLPFMPVQPLAFTNPIWIGRESAR